MSRILTKFYLRNNDEILADFEKEQDSLNFLNFLIISIYINNSMLGYIKFKIKKTS